MKEFYHVARADISELDKLELYNKELNIELPGYYSNREFLNKKNELFPEGLSSHGNQYLGNYYDPDEVNNEFLIEFGIELIRRLKYPNLPSRYQSIFGCLNIDDALTIKNNQFRGEGDIYIVSCNSYFVADMGLLNQSRSILGLEIIGNKYWSGNVSSNPFYEVLMKPPVRIIEKIVTKSSIKR